ncbi:hypothetical protein [Streptomonospora salina]|uniref:Uncharacterized protein n=1 Tax=Streptomonospora salina TaxID=104205 RepID=A0A841E8E1_9ACTN|nr:hypothetical protein [Streptomonospora salina]MBB6000237.1 hypothetical protein [Streptomonospora salina]
MTELIATCVVCDELITAIEWKNGGEVSWELIHRSDADHDPVPAPGSFAEAVKRCDFCSALNPPWRFVTRGAFEMLTVTDEASFVHKDDSAWAACAPCKRLVVKRAKDRLAHRAMLDLRKARPGLGEEFYRLAEQQIRAAHEGFFECHPGAPERLES